MALLETSWLHIGLPFPLGNEESSVIWASNGIWKLLLVDSVYRILCNTLLRRGTVVTLIVYHFTRRPCSRMVRNLKSQSCLCFIALFT